MKAGKTEKAKFQNFSLEQLLETAIQDQQSVRPQQKYKKHEQMKSNMLSNQQPKQQLKKIVTQKVKVQLLPAFDGPTVINSKRSSNKKNQQLPIQKKTNPNNKIQVKDEQKLSNFPTEVTEDNSKTVIIKVQPKEYKPKSLNKDPKDVYPVTFEQSFTFNHVQISLKFGDYKIYEQNIKFNVLVIPFFDFFFEPYMIAEVKKRAKISIQSLFAEFVDRKESLRIGDIVTFNKISNMPYEKVYFVKIPDLDSLPQYNIKKLYQTFKNIVKKAHQDSIQSVVVGDWIWGKLQKYDISTAMFKGLIDGANSICRAKTLREISVCVGRKHNYTPYLKAFREISDQYYNAFY